MERRAVFSPLILDKSCAIRFLKSGDNTIYRTFFDLICGLPDICANLYDSHDDFIVSVYIWQVTGTWRSATAHAVTYKRSFWPNVAKFAIMLGAISAVSNISSMTKQVREYSHIVFRTDGFSDVSIQLLEGTQLQINGYITFDLPGEIQKYLEYNPNITIIHLNSLGGRILPARKIRDMIIEHSLTTYTEEGCFSACTIPFIAGYSRIIFEEARMGFHGYEVPGLEFEQVRLEEEKDWIFFREKGISDNFIIDAFQKRGQDFLMPSLRTLGDENIITHVFDGEYVFELDEYCAQFFCD